MSLNDRFEIGSPIQVGQVATAYPAVQKELGRKILLKVLHQHWVNDVELVERFLREGRAVAAIDHPNVLRVYECGREDNVPYLALEWIEGSTLADKIASGPLRQDDVRRIAAEVLKGLGEVHKRGFLHRDLKPDNILIGNDGRIVLADFSLAGFERSSALTGHGALVGSPAYMAPELVEGKPATLQSDLFGLGVILLECLTGSNPFAARDPLVSLDLVRTAPLPKLGGKAGFDEGLARLVDALLERNPKLRPTGASEALALLDEPPTAKAHEVVAEIPIAGARKKIVQGWTVTIVIAAVIAVIFLALSQIGRKDDESLMPVDSSVHPTAEVAIDETADSMLLPVSSEPEQKQSGMRDSAPVHSAMVKETASPALLTLIVRPWARVVLDGREIGVTPLGVLELTPGQHEFVFKHDAYPPVQRSIALAAGAQDTVSVDMQAETALITFSALPWGYLWIDGDSVGLLPRAEPNRIGGGLHSIRIEHPDYTTWQDTIAVKSGEKLNLKVDLKSGTMIALERSE